MNMAQARDWFINGYLVEAEIIKNPSNTAQWFVLLRNADGKAYMLEDAENMTLVDTRVDRLLHTLHGIGFRQVLVHL